MKKFIFLCFCAFLASCSSNEELQSMNTNEEELTNIINDYELVLKGYSLEDLKKEKDESTPTTQEETNAEPWLIKALQEASEEAILSNYGKMKSEAKAYASTSDMVGVFKINTCGNYREFLFHMDCEDGGDTHVSGNIGATHVNEDGNARFHFCLVPAGNYGGGTLLLYNYTWNISEGDVDVVLRHHDNEDRRNSNRIVNNGGLASTGLTTFGSNTDFYWRFSDKPAQSLGIAYGVIRNKPYRIPEIFHALSIDDENSKNANSATLWMHRVVKFGPGAPPIGQTTSRNLNNGETFRGMRVDQNTVYHMQL